jgi:hypothetical protein
VSHRAVFAVNPLEDTSSPVRNRKRRSNSSEICLAAYRATLAAPIPHESYPIQAAYPSGPQNKGVLATRDDPSKSLSC